METLQLAEVALDIPIQGTLTYRIPPAIADMVRPGCVVEVPLRRRRARGVVLEVRCCPAAEGEFKDLLALLENEPIFTASELEWYTRAARYYLRPLGQVLATALNPVDALPRREGKTREGLQSSSREEGPHRSPPVLTKDQAQAVEEILPAIRSGRFQAFLLWGVTGSGKTEVYLRAAQAAVERGKQALVLVPEISLTHQLVREFRSRFGDKIAVLHSRLSKGERTQMWLAVHRGEVPLVLGARSAIFAPCHSLGLIIVDEEHDPSYKQEEGFRYNARDLALLRGKLCGLPVLLGSATPSLETYCNARLGKFRILSLPERLEGRPLPQTQIVDLRRQSKAKAKPRPISPHLQQAMAETLDRGEQVVLFLNRRGYATFLICLDCGHVFKCANCSVTLVHHLSEGTLRCHYCGWRQPTPALCPSCWGTRVSDLGMGTEALEEAVKESFPKARVLRMDKDTTTRRHAQAEMLRAWRRGEADVLIGTQMVAKGHHVPNVTLVGVIVADTSLNLPDFRASERTFQLLLQVAGRAGRGERPGRVVVQTYDPGHPAVIFSARKDFEAFASMELAQRKEAGYPPFGYLVLFRISSPREDWTVTWAGVLGDVARSLCRAVPTVQCLGPSPAPIWRLKGRFRWQLLLKGPSRAALHKLAAQVLDQASSKLPSKVRLTVDVDPQSFL